MASNKQLRHGIVKLNSIFFFLAYIARTMIIVYSLHIMLPLLYIYIYIGNDFAMLT